jgi:DNA polymerase III subunit gamma/tau
MFDDQLHALEKTSAPEPHRALYLRWRPRRFEDVVSQDHVTRTLRNAVKLDRLAHAYLFTGPRGTGKTSVARILYRAANCTQAEDGDPCNKCELCRAALDGRALDLIEIDAASNRGIDDIRDLREKVAYRPGNGRFKLYIVDEAHELTGPAWEAFLKTLEEPPPHAMFVLATTEAHKVPATIVSRCQRFDFRRIPFSATREQLAKVAASEGMEVEPAVLERLALLAGGGLRDALSLLDQLAAFAGTRVDMDLARAALSLPSVEAVRGVIDGMTRRDPASVMALMSDVADVRLFAEELVLYLRAVLLLRSGADARLGDELPADEVEWLRSRAPSWSVGSLMRLLQTLSESLARTRDAQQFQVQTEVALLAACDVETAAPPAVMAPPPAPTTVPAPAAIASFSTPYLPPSKTAEAVVGAEPSRAQPEPAQPAAAVSSEGLSSLSSETPVEVVRAEPSGAHALEPIKSRWPDVVDHVKSRKPILGALLSSAQPIAVDDSDLTVAFSTDFNRKRAELAANRQTIEAGVRHALGKPYRLRCTVARSADGEQSLLEDPVINYAARTFGGEPKRLNDGQPL